MPRDPACPTCGPEPSFPFLEGDAPRTVRMCGRGAVQVLRRAPEPPDLEALEARLRTHASEIRNVGSMLRFRADDVRVTLFADGRALIEGTEDEGRALALYDRYVSA